MQHNKQLQKSQWYMIMNIYSQRYSGQWKLGWTKFSQEILLQIMEGFPGRSAAKESACNAIPGSGRPPGERIGNSLQYSCLENSTDRGGWRGTVHGIVKSCAELSKFHFHFRGGQDSSASSRQAGAGWGGTTLAGSRPPWMGRMGVAWSSHGRGKVREKMPPTQHIPSPCFFHVANISLTRAKHVVKPNVEGKESKLHMG